MSTFDYRRVLAWGSVGFCGVLWGFIAKIEKSALFGAGVCKGLEGSDLKPEYERQIAKSGLEASDAEWAIQGGFCKG